MKRFSLRRWITTSFALLAIGFFLSYAARHFDKIPPLNWNLMSILVAFISVALVVFSIGVVGSIWFLLLSDNGVAPSWKKAQTIFSISQFGKYLPGNVGQHVGRVVMAQDEGIPVGITVSTMLIEVLWGVGVGMGLALPSMFMLETQRTLGFQLHIGPVLLATGLTLILFLPWVGIKVLSRCFPKLMKRLSGGRSISPPKLRTALVVAALFLLCFILMGLILKLQSQWFFGVAKVNLSELTCLFAVAWLAGYLVPGAPGGLGVRESMMVLLLSPVLGEGTAAGLGITLRLTTTTGDAVAFGLGLLCRKFTHE